MAAEGFNGAYAAAIVLFSLTSPAWDQVTNIFPIYKMAVTTVKKTAIL